MLSEWLSTVPFLLDDMSTLVYNADIIEIVESGTFKRWLDSLRDRRAVARIDARLRRVSLGHIGDAQSVGDGVFEMRVHYGPGYRLYFVREGRQMVILLCGGDKDSQERDIRQAKELAREWRR